MPLAPDVIAYIDRESPAKSRAEISSLVSAATLHDDSLADARCQRAALVASHGSIEKLKYYLALLKVDYRDVLVAGEYEDVNQELQGVRNLNEPFTSDHG